MFFTIFAPIKNLSMKKLLLYLLMLTAPVGFSSCEVDDDSLYDTVVGRVWAGDLGFYDGPYALNSYVYFGADGFGTDKAYYADNGQYLDTLNIQWSTDDRYDTIYINYGNVDYPRELRNVSISRGVLYADLYIGGQRYRSVALYMQ